jgi:hypothetical protein
MQKSFLLNLSIFEHAEAILYRLTVSTEINCIFLIVGTVSSLLATGGSQRDFVCLGQGVTKRCRLSLLTNSALVYEPKCRGMGGGGGLRGLNQ